MNAFSFDITDNSLIVKQENTYPEWVTTERFYNCENFGQIFAVSYTHLDVYKRQGYNWRRWYFC